MKLLKNIILGMFVLQLAACKDFIALTPPTAFPPADFYQNEADIKAAVTGLYGSLRTIYGNYFMLNEMPSDNVQTYSESEAGIGVWDKMTWYAGTNELSAIWINHYNTIAQCNLVINRITDISFSSDALKTQYIGEAKFIRALMYFNLVRYYGDIPLVLDPIENDTEAYTYSRSPVSSVFSQIEQDLTEAEPFVLTAGQVSAADLGRVTNGAVKALLGKVYLQQQKYAEAAAKLAEVVALSSSAYGLLDDYSSVFSTADEYNKEIIFTVQYSRLTAGVGEGSNFAINFAPQPSGTSIVTGGSPASYNIGTPDLYAVYEDGDIRKDMIGVFSTGTTIYYYTKKFLDTPPSSSEGENNWIVIRYADVLLMLAEALNEQGNTAGALNAIQQVRARANLSTNSSLDQSQTRTLIKDERRRELCYEGHRWPDLIRWDDYVTVMSQYKQKYNVPSMDITANKRLFAIPQREISLNPNLTQNPGY